MPNATLVNFAGGETSPKSRGRFDIASYTSSCRKLVNFIAEISGPARFRPGFKHIAHTRGSAIAKLIPFQFSDEQAYILEFTAGKMRVYKDGALVTTARTTITAATKATTAVITVASTSGLSNGDDIVITGVLGMTELNGRTFRLAGGSGSTFQLTDPATGLGIDSSGYTTYISGGSVAEVYEIATPYILASDLEFLNFTQTVDTMYLVHYKYAPRKLTVDSGGIWTLATYSRTNDPFVDSAVLTVTNIEAAVSTTDDEPTESLPALAMTWTNQEGLPGGVWTASGNGRSYTHNAEGGGWASASAPSTLAIGSWAFTKWLTYPSVDTYVYFMASTASRATANGYVLKMSNISSTSITFTLYRSDAGSLTSLYSGAQTISNQSVYVYPRITVDASGNFTMWFYEPRGALGGVWKNVGALATDTAYTTSSYILLAFEFPAGQLASGVVADFAGDGVAPSKTARVTFTAGDVITPDTLYTFTGVVGTTEINSQSYYLEATTASSGGLPRAFLYNSSHVAVDSSAWTPYTSGGTAAISADSPITAAFYENRLVFAGTNTRPRTLFLSAAPDDDGAPQYDVFTGGTDPADACFFSLSPVNGSVDYIAWIGGTAKCLLVGTFGGPFRVAGGGLEEPITPSSINVKQLDAYGCAATAPALNGSRAFFIQRGGGTLRGVQYNSSYDEYVSADMCLNADQIGQSPLKRVVFQTGNPDALWLVREDGQLASMTLQGEEKIAGWHRHIVGGTDAKVIDVAILPRPGLSDQLYVVTERTVDGVTRRAVEVMADDVPFPDIEDFYTGDSDADTETFWNAVYRLQERYVHVDSAVTYNGSDAGVAADATITPGATAIGTGVTFTASNNVFSDADVGKELWKKPSAQTGVGSGRATITAVIDSKTVTASITVAFDSTDAIAAGDWYLAADEISGLWHLEGEQVAVTIDGAIYTDGKTDGDYDVLTVTNGKITLDQNAAVVHVGLLYEGMLITHNLEMGGQTGPAQEKPRNIAKMAIRFMNTLGCEYGTDLYHTEKVVHRSNTFITDRPAPVFSGIKTLHNSDSWTTDSGDKNVVVVQRLPLPCIVQFIDIQYETGDER